METVQLTYKGTAPVIVPDANVVAEPGKTYPIPAELAADLLARGWAKAKSKSPKDDSDK